MFFLLGFIVGAIVSPLAIVAAVWMVAERFEEHVVEFADCGPGTNGERLRQQFEKQMKDARGLIARVEDLRDGGGQ